VTFFFSFFPFFLSGSRPGHTDGPIFARKRSNDAEWRKEVPFGVRILKFQNSGVFCQQNFPKGAMLGILHATENIDYFENGYR
jgi:hypothetical protein